MRRGVSQVVTTVILTSILLTTIGVVVFYATSLIDAHRQSMEYEAGKNLMVYAAMALEQVALGTGGAREVRFALSTVGLNFVDSPLGKLEVYINGQKVLEHRPPAVVLKGGPLVTTVFRMLRPEAEVNSEAELRRLIVEAGEPMVIVYESFSREALVTMIAPRVRVNYLGVFRVAREPGVFVPYNFFEVSYINVTFGRLGGSGHIPLVMRNVGVRVVEYSFQTESIEVRCVLDGQEETITLEGSSGAEGSVVVVRVADVIVSTG